MQTKFFPWIAVTLLSLPHPALAQTEALGQFDGHGDIGSPKNAGSVQYYAAQQQYTMTASGANMWGTNDQFHFLWKKLKGDFILRTRIEFIGKGVEAHRKLGWMVRPSLDSNGPYADCAEHGNGLTSLQFRNEAGAATEEIVLAATNTDVLQFERRGNTYLFSAARFGDSFVTAEQQLNLPDEVYAGLFLCAHNPDVTEKAVFRDVRIIRPAKPGFVPYRDFIGSVLELLEVETGRTEIIHSSEQPFEAPNWTRDGRALIYNISGRSQGWGSLVRFDLAQRKPVRIDTGAINHNNNDHVLSFDGKMLGISAQGEGGQSVIFTVPALGGTPKQITPVGPSYLHSWSPDGKFLLFTGGRSNKFDIYKVPSDGGPEIRLTDSPGLNDGPEYTPDGRHIYFNSTRTGKMQLWRMSPDGSNQEQVTDDQLNNWFPHISPDGRWIVFISFTPETNPADHPYYRQTYIRLMPISGGAPRVIAYVYGGQGTINVPSWSPDGRKLAYVSNTAFE